MHFFCLNLQNALIVSAVQGINRAKGGDIMNKVFDKLVKAVNFSLKADANSTNTTMAFQPKLPAKYEELKKNDKQNCNKAD